MVNMNASLANWSNYLLAYYTVADDHGSLFLPHTENEKIRQRSGFGGGSLRQLCEDGQFEDAFGLLNSESKALIDRRLDETNGYYVPLAESVQALLKFDEAESGAALYAKAAHFNRVTHGLEAMWRRLHFDDFFRDPDSEIRSIDWPAYYVYSMADADRVGICQLATAFFVFTGVYPEHLPDGVNLGRPFIQRASRVYLKDLPEQLTTESMRDFCELPDRYAIPSLDANINGLVDRKLITGQILGSQK
ncbi:MAG: hypothetical protein ABH879_05205 [archaeon]